MAGLLARGFVAGLAEGLGYEAGTAAGAGAGAELGVGIATGPTTASDIAPGFPTWGGIGRGVKGFFSGDIFGGSSGPAWNTRDPNANELAQARREFNRYMNWAKSRGQNLTGAPSFDDILKNNPRGLWSFVPNQPAYVDYTKIYTGPLAAPNKNKTLDVISGGHKGEKGYSAAGGVIGGDLPETGGFTPPEPDYVDLGPGPTPNPQVPNISPPTPGGGSSLGNLPSGILPSQDVHRKHLAGRLSEQQLDALMASEAYEKKRQNQIGGFRYDPTLSDKRVATYYNPTTKKAYVSYRGTAEVGDAVGFWPNVIKGDLSYTERMKQALDYHDRVKNKYGVNARVTGHSLGGSIAQVVARERGAEGAGFNQGATLFGTDKELAGLCAKKKPPPICDRFVQHRIYYDVVSKSATKAKTSNRQFGYNRIPGTNVLNAHFMNNFTDPQSQYWQTHRVRSMEEIAKQKRTDTQRRRRRGGR